MVSVCRLKTELGVLRCHEWDGRLCVFPHSVLGCGRLEPREPTGLRSNWPEWNTARALAPFSKNLSVGAGRRRASAVWVVAYTLLSHTDTCKNRLCFSDNAPIASSHVVELTMLYSISYYDQQLNNYFTYYHTPTCFDTIVSSSGSL